MTLLHFFLRYCTYLGAPSSPITPKYKGIKTMLKVNHEDLSLKQILQRSTDENFDDF